MRPKVTCSQKQCSFNIKGDNLCMVTDCVYPDYKVCPYCGRFVPEYTIEPPADYCHHDIGDRHDYH